MVPTPSTSSAPAVASIVQAIDAAIAEMRAELAELKREEQPEARYVLRYTQETINGVTVIVGVVERV